MVRKNTRRKSQKGGAWYNPTSWFQPSDPYAPKRSWGDYFSGTTSNIENSLSNLSSNIVDSTKSLGSSISNSVSSVTSNSNTGVSPVEPLQQDSQNMEQLQNASPEPTYGGKRRMATRKMRGGKNGLGLTYYATPVSGIKVVQPTYWEVYGDGHIMKAGSKYKSKSTSKKRHNKNKKAKNSRRNKK
jgi:hypothetical protein